MPQVRPTNTFWLPVPQFSFILATKSRVGSRQLQYQEPPSRTERLDNAIDRAHHIVGTFLLRELIFLLGSAPLFGDARTLKCSFSASTESILDRLSVFPIANHLKNTLVHLFGLNMVLSARSDTQTKCVWGRSSPRQVYAGVRPRP